MLQRLLATNEQIYTVAETWLLLTLFSFDHPSSVTTYGQVGARRALADLYPRLPNGRQDILDEVGHAYTKVVSKLMPPTCRFFVEKTPRNYLVLDDILATFPGARFIFLWRHPLAIVDSMMRTFNAGHWKLYRSKVDLFDGLQSMVRCFRSFEEKVHSVRYEHLVEDPRGELEKIASFISPDISLAPPASLPAGTLPGYMGDPTRDQKYDKISIASVNTWREGFDTPVRRRFAKRYVQWIRENDLNPADYDLDTSIDWKGVSTAPAKWARDLMYSPYNWVETILPLHRFMDVARSKTLKNGSEDKG